MAESDDAHNHEGPDSAQEEDQASEETVTNVHAWREVDAPSRALIEDLKATSGRITTQIATQVQMEVPAYSGPADGKRHWLILMAGRAALGQLVTRLDGGPAISRKVDDLYAKMGYGEANDGNDLSLILSTLDRAVILIWDEVRALAVAHDTSAAVLSYLADLLQEELHHLQDQVRTGYGEAQRISAAATVRSRTLDALLTRDQESLAELADKAGWAIPDNVVIVTATRTGDPISLGREYLCSSGDRLIIATAGNVLPDLVRELEADEAIGQAAISWPVPSGEAIEAHKWSQRALDLALRGVLPPAKILNCADHRTQLWLHAEPALRRQLCQELLPPLLAETPNSREILSETLLVWLETRDSAPAIAARLDIHPQTVRYRWKRINELFGEALHDPEITVQLTMLLKASVPMWKAGDQSDFERFHAEDDE